MGLFDIFRSVVKPSAPSPVASNERVVEKPEITSPQEPLSKSTIPSEPFLVFEYSFKEIGRVTAECPHCNTPLGKFPGRKKKCPSCSESIYVRTRPSDRQKVLVTEAEATEIEEQYDAISGIDTRGVEYRFTHEDAALFVSRKKALQAASVSEVQNWQVCVAILEEDSVTHKKNNDWGLFRNARLDTAMLFHKAGNPDKALPYYCQTCFVDINGGSNCGGLTDFCKPFDPSNAMVATGVYELILRALRHTENSDAKIKETFLAATTGLHEECRMPISPATAYSKFAKQLKKQEDIST